MAQFDPDAYLAKNTGHAFDPDAYLGTLTKQPVKQPSIVDDIKQGAVDLLAGGIRGAGSIGATILYPVDKLTDLIKGDRRPNVSGLVTGKQPLSRNEERRKQIDEGLTSLTGDMLGVASNPENLLYKAGKLGGEIAGTAGVGGAVANSARAVLPASAAASPIVANSLRAIETAGMNAGPIGPGVKGVAANLATRSLGGAVTGGFSAGAIDPSQARGGAIIGAAIPPAIYGAGKVGAAIGNGLKTATKNVLGLTTGVGAEPISQAFNAGRSGNKAFLENLRGDVPLTDVLDEAKAGLQAMNAAKNAEYRSGMIPIKGDQTVLSLKGIEKAIDDASGVATYKGQVKNDSANAAIEKMRAIVDEWKQLDPAQFHTPEGLDALKQKLGSILEGIPFNEKQARLAAQKVYSATKAEIESQAPTYAKVMKGYQTASDQINEIERVLSIGGRASKDTAMRKLQSLMRNNVQTNYGNRLSLANTLENQGGVELMPALSGQALNSWTPRSLAGQAGAGTALYMGFSNPLTLAALPFQSPRLVGTLAYGAGRVAGATAQASGSQGAGRAINALANDPSEFLQFGYRAAPALAANR